MSTTSQPATAATMPDTTNTATTSNSETRSRRKMYKNCDRCRQAKRACSAQYASIAEALASKVACTNCKKKGQVCTFNSLINSFGGIPLGGLSGAAFAESLSEVANSQPAPVQQVQDEVMAEAESSTTAAKRRRESIETIQPQAQLDAISKVNAAFDVLNGTSSKENTQDDEQQQRDSKRRKHSDAFSSFANVQGTSSQPNYNNNSLIVSRAQSPFAVNLTEDDLFSSNGGPSLFDILGFDIWSTTPGVRLCASADRTHLNTDLLNVYEGAAESAFRVWVTDATTPYLLSSPSSLSSSSTSLSSSAAMALNKKVCLLDHASKRIFRPDNASRSVEKRVSEAYHAVLLAYAAQWPRHRSGSGKSKAEWRADEARVRLSLWKQARDKLMDAADAWSFRIVFALILFAWTEKPREVPTTHAWEDTTESATNPIPTIPSLDENSTLDSSSWQIPAEASTMMLATAMRKLKAFRLKIQQLRRRGVDLWSTEEKGLNEGEVESRKVEATLLENTYHNLYWFGCMMDTELSVLRKYDAVIGDEDSDLTDQLLSPSRGNSLLHEPPIDTFSLLGSTPTKPLKKIWDEVIPHNSRSNRHTFATSWPCLEEVAKRTLAYATPIKVLLFRHVGRLQSSYWRQASAEVIERQIAHVLSVVRHWDETFAPFFASCIAHHAELPPSIQSWHVITATKWNLAAILLVELISSMERPPSSDPFTNTYELFSDLRKKVCNQTAALIHAIQHSTSVAKQGNERGGGFEYIEATGSTILHGDPWPEISVHGFACVAKSEIKQFKRLTEEGRWEEVRCAEHRVEKCIWALEQLSNRSTMAVDASKEVLGLLEVHSPFRRVRADALGAFLAGDSQQQQQQGGGVGVLTDDVWQSCLKILNETPTPAPVGSNGYTPPMHTSNSSSDSTFHWPNLIMPGDNSTFLDTLTNENTSDGSSSRASSNHSLSPPLTTARLASPDYPSSISISLSSTLNDPNMLGAEGGRQKEAGMFDMELGGLNPLHPFEMRV